MERHKDAALGILTDLARNGGVRPDEDDPGMMGWIARTEPAGGNTRVFPKGGFRWAMLDAYALPREAAHDGAHAEE